VKNIFFVMCALLGFLVCSAGYLSQEQQPLLTDKKPAEACQLPTDVFRILQFESGLAQMAGGTMFLDPSLKDLKSSSVAASEFRDWLGKHKGDGTRGQDGQCYETVSKYQSGLLVSLDNLRYQTDKGLLYSNEETPFRFLIYDGQKLLLVSSIVSTQIYNSLRLNDRARAAKELHSTAIPALREIYQALAGTDLKYYGVIVVYGVKDFSDEGIFATHTEVIAIISNSAVIGSLADGKTTEEEMADKSSIYLESADPGSQLVKVKVEPE
jgi:hypothetical protein